MSSAHWLRHTVPPWLSPPGTASPEVRTVTWLSVPSAAVTVMPADGSASLAPLAGVIVTRGAARCPEVVPARPGLPLAAAPVRAAALAWLVPCPPPEHPVASSARAATAARPRVIFRTALTSAPVPHRRVLYTRRAALPAARCLLSPSRRRAASPGCGSTARRTSSYWYNGPSTTWDQWRRWRRRLRRPRRGRGGRTSPRRQPEHCLP